MNITDKIKDVINKLRPYMQSDGGDIEFIKFEDGIVYVRFSGACANCHLIDVTLKDGVELALTTEIPEVLEVRQI